MLRLFAKVVQRIDVYKRQGIIIAKSKQMKSISKLSLIPGVFNINEPVIFGLPIVFNPLMLIPLSLIHI